LHSAPGAVGVFDHNHIHILVCGTDGAPYRKSWTGHWTEWAVNIRENCVREAIHVFNEVLVSHIAGASNPADIFTKKFKSDAIFRTLRGLLLFYPSSFFSDGVPR